LSAAPLYRANERNYVIKNGTLSISLSMDFIQYSYTDTYVNIVDVVTALGGIGATISLLTGYIAFLFIIQYNAQLSGVITRKEKDKYRRFKVKQLLKFMPQVRERIQELHSVAA
jgi:hypothetical protein